MTGSQKAMYYYLANQDTINEGHLGEYVAIYDNKVEGYFKDFWDAFRAMARKKYPLGSYGLEKCVPEGQPMADVGGLMIETGGNFWQHSR
jgi:hypothetical protein